MVKPKLRFKEFNEEYKKYKIGNTLKVKSGKDKKLIECMDGRYPILGTGGKIGTTNNLLYDKPSVLIGRKGTINKATIYDYSFLDSRYFVFILI